MIEGRIAAIIDGSAVWLDGEPDFTPAVRCLVRCRGPTGARRADAYAVGFAADGDRRVLLVSPPWPLAWAVGDTVYFDETESP